MVLLPRFVSLVLLLSTACLAFGAPAPATPSPPLPQSPPAGSPASATSSVSDDGYMLTVKYLQICEKKAAELEAALQKLQAETTAGSSGDKVKQQAAFLKKLTELYPGSTFDGTSGTVPFLKGIVATFNSALKVDSIREDGKITITYLLAEGRIQLSQGANSITAIIDRVNPSRSVFVKVKIPDIEEEAERILWVQGQVWKSKDTVESAVLNDAYQLLSQTNRLRMDTFAADIIRNPALQAEALKIAGKGYRERHPEEYQAGTAPPPKTRKKKTDASPKLTADDLYKTGAKIGIFVLLIAGAFGVMVVAFRLLKSVNTLSMDKVKKIRVDKYTALSPMVTRSLKKFGRSLWGRNFPWSKKYYIYPGSDRWLLCDGKYDKLARTPQAKNRLEVCMRSTYFKIKLKRLNGARVDVSVTCKDLSEQELREKLKEVCSYFVNADTLYGDAAVTVGPAEEAMPEIPLHTEVSPVPPAGEASGRIAPDAPEAAPDGAPNRSGDDAAAPAVVTEPAAPVKRRRVSRKTVAVETLTGPGQVLTDTE